MHRAVVVDLRNIYRPDEMKRHGFAYACVGRMNDRLQSGLAVAQIFPLAAAPVDNS